MLVLEYCELGDLRRAMRRRERFDPKTALEVVIPVAGALALAHSGGIAHRDVKPENILMTRDYIPKLTDFNIARIMSAVSRVSSGKVAYMIGYAAPEQLGIPGLPRPGPL